MLVITTQCFPPVTGGIEILMYNLCTTLSDADHQLVVFADAAAESADVNGIFSTGFTVNRYAGLKPLRRWKKAHDIALFCRQNNIRGLIADSWKSLEYIDPGPLGKIICLAHGSELPTTCSASKARRIRKSLDKATCIVANSNFTAGRVASFVKTRDRICVIPPGITTPLYPDESTTEFVRRRLSQNSPILITIARLSERKGQQRVLKTLPALLKFYPRLLYVIIGDGPYRVALERMTRDLRLDQHVLFTGTLHGQLKNAYLQQARLFVMPSFSPGTDVEGFGISYIEAASFGIPSIAGDSGGASEAVLHEKTGLICHAEDTSALFASIKCLLDDKKLYQQLAENARNRAKQLEWHVIIRRYEKLLDS